MRIAFIADPHIANHRKCGGTFSDGTNTRGRVCLNVLSRALEEAEVHGADIMVVLGDLFDVDKPEPTLLHRTLLRFVVAPMTTFLLVGNHDQHSEAPYDHGFPVAAMLPSIAVVDEPFYYAVPEGPLLVMVPYRRNTREVIHDALIEGSHRLGDRLHTDGMVVAIHAGIIDSGTPPWLRNAHDAVPVELLEEWADMFNVRAFFCGNWHNRLVRELKNGCVATQVGTLIPTGWDNAGLHGYGGLAIYDTETGSSVLRTIPGPRFTTLEDNDLLFEQLQELAPDAYEERGEADPLYVRVVAHPSRFDALTEQLEAFEARLGGWDLVPPAASLVATQARGAITTQTYEREGLESACSAFVGAMDLDPVVERSEVLQRVLEVLT